MRTHVKREGDILPLSLLGREKGEVQVAQAVTVADDFDCSDLPLCEGEAKHAKEASPRSDDEPHTAVDERGLGCACATSCSDCAAGPVLRSTDLSHRLYWLRGAVGANDDVRIEHGDERVEIARAQGGEESVDSFAL